MARFDVYRNTGAHSAEVPYLLDVQSELLHGLETCVVVPLRRRDCFPAAIIPENLTPMFRVDSVECILETPKLAAVPRRLLKKPVVSLAASQFQITAALDFLFQGF